MKHLFLIISFLWITNIFGQNLFWYKPIKLNHAKIDGNIGNPTIDKNGIAYIQCLFKGEMKVDNKTIKGINGKNNFVIFKLNQKGEIIGTFKISTDSTLENKNMKSLFMTYNEKINMLEIGLNNLIKSIIINDSNIHDSAEILDSKLFISNNFASYSIVRYTNTFEGRYLSKTNDKHIGNKFILNTNYYLNKKFALFKFIDTTRYHVKDYQGLWKYHQSFIRNGKIFYLTYFDNVDYIHPDSQNISISVTRLDSTGEDLVVFCTDTLGNPLYLKKIALTGRQLIKDSYQHPFFMSESGNFYGYMHYEDTIIYKNSKFGNGNKKLDHLVFFSFDTNADIRWVQAVESFDVNIAGTAEHVKDMYFDPINETWEIIYFSNECSFAGYKGLSNSNSPYILVKFGKNGEIRQVQRLFEGYTSNVFSIEIKNGKIIHYCHTPMMWEGVVYGDSSYFFMYYDTVTGWVKNDPLPPMRASEIHFYPNPAHEYIYVEGKENEALRIYDLQGRIMHSSNSSGPLQIPVQSWPEGMYILQSGTKTGKVMVVR